MQNPTETERQALDAAIRRTTTRCAPHRQKSTDLPYPELPRFENEELRRLTAGESTLFWLADWQRDLGQLEALQTLHASPFIQRRLDANRTLRHASYTCDSMLRAEADRSLVNLTKFGGLLFAWHGTTALKPQHRPAFTAPGTTAALP